MGTPEAVEIPFRDLAHGHSYETGGGLFFYRTQDSWAAQWRRMHHHRLPEPPLAGVDWAIDMVVLLVCGTRPSGGYQLTIESIAVDGTSIEVRAVERRPGRNAYAPAVITNPFHAVAVAAHDCTERLTLRIEYHHFDP